MADEEKKYVLVPISREELLRRGFVSTLSLSEKRQYYKNYTKFDDRLAEYKNEVEHRKAENKLRHFMNGETLK